MAQEFVVDASLGKNRKFRDLAKRLMGLPNAYSALFRLWAFAALHRPTGDLTEIDPGEVPLTEAEWRALREARGPESSFGFIEYSKEGEVRLHDWGKNQRWIHSVHVRTEAARLAGKASAAVRREAQARLWQEALEGKTDGAGAPVMIPVGPLTPGNRYDPFRDPALEAWLDKGFKWFWHVYPKREKKIEARDAWGRLHRHLLLYGRREGISPKVKEKIAVYIGERIESGEWQATPERKRFIPSPAVFLNQRRWTDEEDSDGEDETKGTDAGSAAGAPGRDREGAATPEPHQSVQATSKPEVGPVGTPEGNG